MYLLYFNNQILESQRGNLISKIKRRHFSVFVKSLGDILFKKLPTTYNFSS